jgi:hypothetical protein
MSTTGRYFLRDRQTGRLFCIEPLSERAQKLEDRQWSNGGIDQVRGGSIREEESIIRAENGFTGITYLPAGTSPDAYIQALVGGQER